MYIKLENLLKSGFVEALKTFVTNVEKYIEHIVRILLTLIRMSRIITTRVF